MIFYNFSIIFIAQKEILEIGKIINQVKHPIDPFYGCLIRWHLITDDQPVDDYGQQRITMNLDQFYTKPKVANLCWSKARPIFNELVGNGAFYIEPSAGNGVFYNLLPADSRFGLDLEPHHAEVIKRDFLRCRYKPPVLANKAIVIGNPPFGKRGKLAIDFMNKAFTIADTVAFIVPVIFRKYFIHKQIDANAQLIMSMPLERDAFITFSNAHYSVNTEFQIWSKIITNRQNRRLLAPSPISHPHFSMWQYNNTPQMLKMFDNSFDFAVPCQGYQDYNRRETTPAQCEKHKQWMLFKALSKQVKERLYSGINYYDLSVKHTTSTPGFRKGDMVMEYAENYG